MKTKFLAFLLVLPMLAFCDTPIDPAPGEDDQIEQTPNGDEKPEETPSDTTPAPLPEDLAPEIKNGDVVLATNADVQKFLEDVHYNNRDYSSSSLLTWGQENGVKVCPGDSYKPQTYTIRWEADAAAGDIIATLSEGTWSRDYNIKAGESYLEITNLCPKSHYTYVVKAGDKVFTEGEFYTYGVVHQIYARTEIKNCRDLGGWKTQDGRYVKYRMIFRGGRLDKSSLAVSGREHFKAEGIKAQLDLRGKKHNDVIENKEDSPLLQLYELDEFEFCAPIIEEGYTYLLKQGEKTRQVMQFIMDCVKDNKPVYFHCSLGRDRTGTVAMLILGILGVPEGDISQEYELTQFAPSGWATSSGEKTKMTRLADYDSAANFIWNNYVGEGETFADGVEKYFLEIGILQADIDAFREAMIVDAYPDYTPAN